MSCAFDKERLTAFFDGELDAAERAETERHISGCSECLRDLGEIKSAASAVKILERPRAPGSIAEGVSREIAARGRVRRLDVWRGRLLVGVAAAAVVLIALNISFFTKPPTADEPLARNSSPAPAIGMARPSDVQKDAPAEGAERESAKASDRLLEKGAADKAPSDGADHRARRALQTDALKKTDEADRAATNALRQQEKKQQAAPAAEPKAEAPLKPQAALGAKADAAPAPAAPPPAPPAAKPAPAPVEESRRTESKELADGKAEKAGELQKGAADPAAPRTAAAAALPEVPAYTVRGGKDARAQAEALVKSWSAPAADAESAAKRKAAVASGAPGGGRAFGALPEPLVLEVTPEQFEALRAELAKAGVTIEAGAPESLRGAAGKDVVSGGGGAPAAVKERAEQKAPAETEGKLKTAAPKRRITLHFVEATPRK